MRLSSALLIAAAAICFLSDATQNAQAATCTQSLNTCAARCRKDNPTDRNCVADHCSPKFAICKSTGCWQQGGDYGNVRTCTIWSAVRTLAAIG